MKKFITYLITLSLLLLVSFVLFSNVLDIGNSLSRTHISLEIIFYVVSGFLFFYLILSPLLTVLFAKNYSIAKYCDEDINYSHVLIKRAKRLIEKGNLDEESKATLQECLKDTSKEGKNKLAQRMYIIYNNQIKQNIDQLVIDSAKDTLVLTAMSQNGFVDFVVVLTNNFRMIKKIIQMCGFRPTFMRTMKLYANVFFSSLVADGAQKIEMSSLISSSLTGFSKVITNSLANGALNALFMLRVGMLAKNYLYCDDIKKKKFSLRNNSIFEACKLFPSVVMSMITSPIKSVSKLFSKKEEEQEIEEEVPEVKWGWRLKKEKKVR